MSTTKTKGTFNNRPLFPIVEDIIALRAKVRSTSNDYRTRDRARRQLVEAVSALSAEGRRQLEAQTAFESK